MLLGVLLCPECRGRVSLGHKEGPQAWLSHLPTRGWSPPEACPHSPICSAGARLLFLLLSFLVLSQLC